MIGDAIVDTASKAYLAGIIDGEGTVTLARKHRNELHSPEVSVANTNQRLIVWLKNKTGSGTICLKQKRSIKHRTAYTWKIRGDKAIALLKEISRWLIIKKPHADLILRDYKKLTPRNGRYDEQTLKKKMKLVALIRALNSR